MEKVPLKLALMGTRIRLGSEKKGGFEIQTRNTSCGNVGSSRQVREVKQQRKARWGICGLLCKVNLVYYVTQGDLLLAHRLHQALSSWEVPDRYSPLPVRPSPGLSLRGSEYWGLKLHASPHPYLLLRKTRLESTSIEPGDNGLI